VRKLQKSMFKKVVYSRRSLHFYFTPPFAGFDQASDASKQMTDVMPHPAAGDADDRDAYAAPMQPMLAQPSVSLIGGPDFDPEAEVVDNGATREIGVQVSPCQL